MEERAYAIITGNGRSGTHWLMNMLDASPFTHCRSEPYGIRSSPFNQLPQIWVSGAAAPEIERQWDDIISWSNSRIGERDHRFRHPKRYIHPLSQKSRIAMLMTHPVIRRVMGLMQPSFRNSEWPLPWWVGSQRRLEEAYAVFKINLDQRIAGWLLANRPQARLLHIVRHPCGRLNSWLNRFLASRDSERVLAFRKERLRKIGEGEPAWREKFGSIDTMSVIESEVWFWLYVNESIHAIARSCPAYLPVVYEELAEDPLSNARKAYQFCGLPWDGQVEAIISAGLNEAVGKKISGTPASIAQSWKTKLPPEHIRTVENIVHDSPLMRWWGET